MSFQYSNLIGCQLSLNLARFAEQNSGVMLLITPDQLSAQHLFDELQFFLADSSIESVLFPDWETLPYDIFSPHHDIISSRLQILNKIPTAHRLIVITHISTLMHRLCPKSFIQQYALTLKIGQDINDQAFKNELIENGYFLVPTVLEHGTFAVRGNILDIFPMGHELPLRIEIFDNSIESLRSFDPETQKTIHKLDQISILPAHEFPLNEEGINLFRKNFREKFSVNPNLVPIYQMVSEGKAAPGIEYYLPLFFNNTACITEYLPEQANVFYIGDIQTPAQKFWEELQKQYQHRNIDSTRPCLSPDICFIAPEEFNKQFKKFEPIKCTFNPDTSIPILQSTKHAGEPFAELKQFIQTNNSRYLFVAESTGRREMLATLLKQSGIDVQLVESWQYFINSSIPIAITIGHIAHSANIPSEHLCIISETTLFGQPKTPQSRRVTRTVDPDLIVRSLVELRVGAPVVHLDFGVGRYDGLQLIETQGIENEFIVIRYAHDDKIYVPVTSLHLITRYTGTDPEHAPLHKLGTDTWQKEKASAAEKIHDVAIELLETYAKREASKGTSFTIDKQAYERFCNLFLFEETHDQLRTINEIIHDMQSTKPMDRLICGDVGFGKTEVALRAAFIAANDGKQVCILVPTTLLADQHYETFKERFAEFPIKVEMLSRFKSANEAKKIILDLEAGQVDIIIGTHKLLQKSINFKRLGLLIIDEEHRFGVKQKEEIRSIKSYVDVLSMTATPIPRTLNMAFQGIRDISLITTPPARRLAIKTFCFNAQSGIIREAILREILRAGQVFFLHNNVQTIHTIAEDLISLVPEASIRIAHGQMREIELERIMSDFYHHRFNVLICTTIIETGIDIPTANTIIINNAHQFGLAQLHQLRGRVGRSHHQAYAYLLVPDKDHLTKDAEKRLDAIVALEDLGAGFTLATHDLEIRGAGELLGDAQSGNMQAIGFSLYMDLLNQTVEDLKSGKTPELNRTTNQGPEIEFGISTIIPEDYIPDIHTRLIFYKRIATATSETSLHNIQIELIDRFGLMPLSVKQLILITKLKWKAEKLKLKRLRANQNEGQLEFFEQAPVNTAELIKLIQLQPKRYQMKGPLKLKFVFQATEVEKRVEEIEGLLARLSI